MKLKDFLRESFLIHNHIHLEMINFRFFFENKVMTYKHSITGIEE